MENTDAFLDFLREVSRKKKDLTGF